MAEVKYVFWNLNQLGKKYVKVYHSNGEIFKFSDNGKEIDHFSTESLGSLSIIAENEKIYLMLYNSDNDKTFYEPILGKEYFDKKVYNTYKEIPDPFKKEEPKKEEVKEEVKKEETKPEIKEEKKEEKPKSRKSHKRKTNKKIKKEEVKKEVEKFYEEHPRKIKKDVEPEYIAGAVAGNIHEEKVENKKERKLKKYPPAKKVIEYYKEKPDKLTDDTKPSEVAGAVLGEIKEDKKSKKKRWFKWMKTLKK